MILQHVRSWWRAAARSSPSSRAGWLSSAGVLAALCCTLAAFAQTPAVRRQGGTLPVSNEALLLTSRIEQALHVGDDRLAIRLIDELAALHDGLVATPASRVYRPVWRQAFRLAGQFPESAVELYRQLHDAEVATLFEQARARGDVAALRRLFRRYRLSAVWPRIGTELAAQLLDRGRFGEAAEVLRDLLRAGAPDAEVTRAQLVVALAGVGAIAPARRLLDELRSHAPTPADPLREQRLNMLARWMDEHAGPAAGAAGDFAPALRRGVLWSCPLEPDGRATADPGDELTTAIDVMRQLPAYGVATGAGKLAVRVGGRLRVLDAETLVPLWGVDPDPDTPPASFGPETQIFGELAPAQASVEWSPETTALLTDHLGQAVTIAAGLVLTIDRLTPTGPPVAPPIFPGARGKRQPRRNELVARDCEDGHIVWRSSDPPSNPLFDAVFQSVPLLVGGRLVAPIQRGDRLNLALLDPADGHLLREMPLVGPPTYFPAGGGRCHLLADDDTLYVCTGNGVIAALTLPELRWKWASVYPSTAAINQVRFWWQPVLPTERLDEEPPILAGDLLIVAPADSREIIGLDRFHGERRWRLPRERYPYLLGTTADGLILAGSEVICVDSAAPDLEHPRWRSVPLAITGRGVVRAGRIFVPTVAGIVELDGHSGRVRADQEPGPAAAQRSLPSAHDRPPPVANLALAGDALLAIAPRRIVKYPDPTATRARLASATPPAAPARAALVLAWLDIFEHQPRQALGRLADAHPRDRRLAAACDRLREIALLSQACDLPAGPQRLALLRQARALAHSPGRRAALSLRIGRTLEQMDRIDAALREYGEILGLAEGGDVAVSAEEGLRRACWLEAAERIAKLAPRADRATLEALVARAVADDTAAESTAALRHLYFSLSGDSLRSLVGLHLACRRWSPEQKLRYLPDDDPAWPLPVRRRLLLERWDVHVSLGMLEAARDDAQAWAALADATAGGAPPAARPGLPKPLSASAVRRRVAAVRLAQRKLEADRGTPFVAPLSRQWRAPGSELLLDPRQPLAATSLWMLTADLAGHKITLINTFKHQQPQRQTDDRLEHPSGRLAGDEAVRGGGERDAWPMTRCGPLAVVPVPGGVVCVGLGPERYAGRRQWERAIPQWRSIPADYADRALGTSAGFCFLPRRSRLVMVDWGDGRVRWSRDLADLSVRRIEQAGENLLLIGQDWRVWTLDARDGRRLRRVDTGPATPRRVDVVAGMLIVWGTDYVAGLDGKTLRRVWGRASAAVVDTTPAAGRPWLAYRTRDSETWRMFDVRTGRPVVGGSLGEFSAVTAIVAQGERVYVGGQVGWHDKQNHEIDTRIVALDAASGRVRWMQDFCTGVPIHASQLAAHPWLIPVLLAASGEEQAAEVPTPAVQLVDKATGRLDDPLPIGDDFRRLAEATCEMALVCTPARVIVQAGGNLIAYGNSPLRRMP